MKRQRINFKIFGKMIKREFAEKWIYKLKKYWLEKNIDGVCSLFTNTKFYQETPFIKPFLTIEEIKEEWYHVKNEEIHNIEINVLAIDGNTVIANWYLEQNNDVYDGIYQIMFNDKNECIYFKSWEMLKLWDGNLVHRKSKKTKAYK